MTPLDTSVYIHFPWCAKKCPYCDFATTKRDPSDIPHEAYADALIAELAHRGPFVGRRLVSVFFGGGTPSLWSASSLGRVLSAVIAAFDSRVRDLEVTSECNPNSLTADQAAAFAAAGINRMSVGVQSLRNDQLSYLGRLHDRQEALEALQHARRNVSRVSADLMFGMPRQQTLAAEVDAVVATGVQHVSAYALTIEAGTQFGERFRLGKLEVSDDEQYADLFEEAEARFAEHGFTHYEVSNYSRAGEEARHNLHYWRGGDYVGLGAAAVGCLSTAESARRYKNAIDAGRYMSAPGEIEEESEMLHAQDRIREALMLGLRTRDGVDLKALSDRVGADPYKGRERPIEQAVQRGDLVLEGSVLRVPARRWLLLDGIVASLF